MSVNQATNIDRALAAWGPSMPHWVRLLAGACDITNQRAVGDRLGKSSGYVSRLVNRTYTGSYEEAETIVRARFGEEEVACPLWGPIALATCLRNRRRSGPARNQVHLLHARHCPTCPNNTDRSGAGEED